MKIKTSKLPIALPFGFPMTSPIGFAWYPGVGNRYLKGSIIIQVFARRIDIDL